jgi:AcrR family transcriptional regulator
MARLTREESRIRTRRMLQEAATKEIARCGYAGTSVDSIAEAAGFSSGAFYSNYREKQEILIDIIRQKQAGESTEWQLLIQRGKTVDGIIGELSARAERFARDDDWLLLEIELELRAARDIEFRKVFSEYRSELRKEARAVLERLFEKADRKNPDNIDTLADVLLAIFIGIGLYFKTETRSAQRKALRVSALEPFLRSLLAAAEPLA